MEMNVLMIAGEGEILIKKLYLVMMKNQCGNRKQCLALIKHHAVIVNGQVMTNEDYIVNDDDVIEVDGKTISSQPFVYYMMNKPAGYVCANRDEKYPCVIDLIERDDCYCLGRLDLDTTGLLLLTNDASLSKQLLLPQHHVTKIYFVECLKPLDQSLVLLFHEGIMIDRSVKCLPAQLDIIDEYHCYLTISEGKYHQIKKMFLSCHNQVVSLKRIGFANILLDSQLLSGDYRPLTKDEFQKLKEFMFHK